MLKQISLSFSSLCRASCIYCPPDRAHNIKNKQLSFELAEKIVAELCSSPFQEKHAVSSISISENGDAFLNPLAIPILRLIKSKLPSVSIIVFTNFDTLTPDKAEIILKERLIDTCYCNIDGATEKTYMMVKKLKLETVQKNLNEFLRLRNKLKSPASLSIQVITLHDYITGIKKIFGFYPHTVKDSSWYTVPDDFKEIKKIYAPYLNPRTDNIFRSTIVGWAEREYIDTETIDYAQYQCPLVHRILTEAFIAADGSWYICCLDGKNEVILGSAAELSIQEIYESEKRKKIITMLVQKKFKEIGGPCTTVNACHQIHRSRWMKIYYTIRKAKEWLT